MASPAECLLFVLGRFFNLDFKLNVAAALDEDMENAQQALSRIQGLQAAFNRNIGGARLTYDTPLGAASRVAKELYSAIDDPQSSKQPTTWSWKTLRAYLFNAVTNAQSKTLNSLTDPFHAGTCADQQPVTIVAKSTARATMVINFVTFINANAFRYPIHYFAIAGHKDKQIQKLLNVSAPTLRSRRDKERAELKEHLLNGEGGEKAISDYLESLEADGDLYE